MAPKRVIKRESEPRKQRARKVMSLHDKIMILDKINKGSTYSSLGREYGCNESTIRSIKHREDKIRASVYASPSVVARRSYVTHQEPLMETMEKLLYTWIEDRNQRKMPLNYAVIRNEALSLYKHLKAQNKTKEINKTATSSFLASKGWFDNFKKRFHFDSKFIKEGETGDVEATLQFPSELKKIIEDGGYRPEQVFNADETGLFWKRMPSRTCISMEERSEYSFKAVKDRITLLFCSNASGDFKCKPMLVYRTENPYALKGKKKAYLPVHWRSNEKAWVTGKEFESWVENCFAHEVEKYLMEKNLSFKVLLLIDNAVGHPVTLTEVHPNIEIVFLPPNIIPPMNQSVITTFKSCYLRRCFETIVETMDKDPSLDIRKCWDKFTILTAIENISEAWKEVQSSTVNSCWKEVWPEVVQDFRGFPNIESEINKIIQLAKHIGGAGFEDVEKDDIQELLHSHKEELTNDELEELYIIDDSEDNESDKEEQTNDNRKLNAQSLLEIFKAAETLKMLVVELDPFYERSLNFRRIIDEAVAPYLLVYKNIVKYKRDKYPVLESKNLFINEYFELENKADILQTMHSDV